jgi:hypothetical protein
MQFKNRLLLQISEKPIVRPTCGCACNDTYRYLPSTQERVRQDRNRLKPANMKDDRLRSPVKPDYMAAVGLAVYAFAACEWQVVWCSEKILPGSLIKLVSEERTAGKIAKFFIDLTRSMPKSDEREQLKAAAAEFGRLVVVRNSIIHGKPCTGASGEARLSSGMILEQAYLEDAADAFTACGIELNRLFYGFLATYVPQ